MGRSLLTDTNYGIGVCWQIHTHVEKYLNDVGVTAAAVGEQDHVFALAKTKNGLALINYGNVISTGNNVEKILEIYQQGEGKTIFQYPFFKNSKFKYQFITKDGRRFLDFAEFDKSSNPLANLLIRDLQPEPDLKLTLDKKDFSDYKEINFLGFFTKLGDMYGTVAPLRKMEIAQYGFKRKFNLFWDFIKMDINLDFINGKIYEDGKSDKGKEGIIVNKISGSDTNFGIATNRKKGLNFGFRYAQHSSFLSNPKGGAYRDEYFYSLIEDNLTSGGVSYKIPFKNIIITPYFILQGDVHSNINSTDADSKISEYRKGASLDINISNKLKLFLESYYLKKTLEKGAGSNIKLGNKNVGAFIRGQKTTSDYVFCPDKKEYTGGVYFNHKNFEASLELKTEETNYSGEKDNQNYMNFKTGIKF